ncbi:uncharacterized protein LOC130734086 [Lotus japonicus]|uniref:uncharacterized protein LOC130734086 n=1 Tax=Lotus japonicus TaxID=34305 RepID=UPI00258B0F2B|nr:uncharacterized protein LOC130734086 [Lotus japonicus]
MNGSPFCAEALALRDGLRLAWERGFRKIICESDSLEVVKVVQHGGRFDTHVHGQILSEIGELLNRKWRVELGWVAREGNMVADWLAKQGSLLSLCGFNVVDVTPPGLGLLLLKDSLGVA